jgi:hypothetical protein
MCEYNDIEDYKYWIATIVEFFLSCIEKKIKN